MNCKVQRIYDTSFEYFPDYFWFHLSTPFSRLIESTRMPSPRATKHTYWKRMTIPGMSFLAMWGTCSLELRLQLPWDMCRNCSWKEMGPCATCSQQSWIQDISSLVRNFCIGQTSGRMTGNIHKIFLVLDIVDMKRKIYVLFCRTVREELLEYTEPHRPFEGPALHTQHDCHYHFPAWYWESPIQLLLAHCSVP